MKRKTNLIPILGFIILTGMVTLLMISSSIEAWIFHPATGLIAIIILFGALVSIYYEGKDLLSELKDRASFSRQFLEFLAVFLGGVITSYLSYEIGMGVVVASSVVAIIVDLIWPDYGVPAFCGSFVGMSSNLLFFNYYEVALASMIGGLVYVLTRDTFSGFGGKLGTIAFIAAAITGLGLRRPFIIAPVTDLQISGLVILISLIATPLTFYLNCDKGHGPVMASGVVGLLGGLILPPLFPVHGTLLAVVAFCASFTGMSNTKRCPAFWLILVAGLFTGVLFVFSIPLLGGAGGKLGTIAFASILSTYGFIHLYETHFEHDVRHQSNQEHEGTGQKT